MKCGSLFSGIGGMDYGLHMAGFEHQFFCESDEWRRSVLATHWPGIPIYEDVGDVARGDGLRGGRGDLTSVEGGERSAQAAGLRSLGRAELNGGGGADGHLAGRGDAATEPGLLDLLCGGFPCQDVSVAGNRRGLAGERSGLFFEFARIAESLRPRWLLVENVPGLFSSHGGRDFGVVLGTLADVGYGLAWRTLDSRLFGVPQRRKRVFIVGAHVDGDPHAAAQRAGEVLAVGTRCARHPATSSEAEEDDPGASESGAGRGISEDVASTLLGKRGKGGGGVNIDEPLIAMPLSHGSNPNSNMAGRRREDDFNLVASFAQNQREEVRDTGLIAGALAARPGMKQQAYLASQTSVRRLMPVECERLQALPDGWTDYGADSRRYAALGDAVTASVAFWIGKRMMR